MVPTPRRGVLHRLPLDIGRRKVKDMDRSESGPYLTDAVGSVRTYSATPPPSPGGVSGQTKVDTQGIDDTIVVGVIEQLEKTGNRPHLLKELAAVLSSTIPIVERCVQGFNSLPRCHMLICPALRTPRPSYPHASQRTSSAPGLPCRRAPSTRSSLARIRNASTTSLPRARPSRSLPMRAMDWLRRELFRHPCRPPHPKKRKTANQDHGTKCRRLRS